MRELGGGRRGGCTPHPGAAGVAVGCSQGPPALTVGCNTALVPGGGG